MKVEVGDIVRMKHGIADQRVIGILDKDRIDVVDARDHSHDRKGIGVPLEWVDHIITKAKAKK